MQNREDDKAVAPSGLDVTRTHDEMRADGFAKLPGLVRGADLDLLRQAVNKLLSGPSQSWGAYGSFVKEGQWRSLLLADANRNTNLFDFPGEDAELDRIINSVLGRQDIQQLLNRILGNKYRVWYAQIRRAEPSAPAGKLHQDLPGEIGLGILVSDTPEPQGTTVFIKGSHRWPRLLENFRMLNCSHVPRWVSGATGSAGDGYVFYNDTWHGLAATSEPRTAILLTFLPEMNDCDSRIPSADLLNQLPENFRHALSTASSLCESNADPGPDQFVKGGEKHSLLSAWSPLIFAAKCYEMALKVYRTTRTRRDNR